MQGLAADTHAQTMPRQPQDGEGCRVAQVGGEWLFECGSLPPVSGGARGVRVAPCPGAALVWRGGRVELEADDPLGGGRLRLAVGPGGVIACSLGPAPAGAEEAAADQQQGPEGGCHSADGLQLVLDMAAAAAAHAAACADGGGGGAEAAVTLADICTQPECRGLLAFDLAAGEAALHESEWCHLHLRGGCIAAWVAEEPGCAPEPPELQAGEAAAGPLTDEATATAAAGSATSASALEEAGAAAGGTEPGAGAWDEEEGSSSEEEESEDAPPPPKKKAAKSPAKSPAKAASGGAKSPGGGKAGAAAAGGSGGGGKGRGKGAAAAVRKLPGKSPAAAKASAAKVAGTSGSGGSKGAIRRVG